MNNIVSVDASKELSSSYLTYSLAIFNRSLPSVVDGLKVAQRRAILGMKDLNLSPEGQYKKVSRLEGHVLGNYHPQGGCAGTIVNMGQATSFRYPLTAIHGNVGGSLQDGRSVGQATSEDPPAAARYLEVKSSLFTKLVYIDQIDKVSIDWRDNYDGSTQEVSEIVPILPALLVNGSTGIASGYACNHIPYNLEEVIDGTIAYLQRPSLGIKGLMKFITGPDLQNGARIENSPSIKEVIETGKGSLKIFGEWKFEKVKRGKTTRDGIIVTSLANGSSERFLEKVREGLENDKITGIADAIDLSSRDGVEIQLILKSGADKDACVQQLLAYTTLSDTFSVNATAIDGLLPSTYGVLDIIRIWHEARKSCLSRKFTHEIEQIDSRIHILNGLLKILAKIDVAIKIIKGAKDKDEAREGLKSKFSIDSLQANAILSMTLSKLINSETLELKNEAQNLQLERERLQKMLNSEDEMNKFIISELRSCRKLGNGRRSELIPEGKISFVKPKVAIVRTKKTKLPTTQEKIKEEAKSLGIKRTEVKKFFEDNVGKGGLYALWKKFVEEKSKNSRKRRKIK